MLSSTARVASPHGPAAARRDFDRSVPLTHSLTIQRSFTPCANLEALAVHMPWPAAIRDPGSVPYRVVSVACGRPFACRLHLECVFGLTAASRSVRGVSLHLSRRQPRVWSARTAIVAVRAPVSVVDGFPARSGNDPILRRAVQVLRSSQLRVLWYTCDFLYPSV